MDFALLRAYQASNPTAGRHRLDMFYTAAQYWLPTVPPPPWDMQLSNRLA